MDAWAAVWVELVPQAISNAGRPQAVAGAIDEKPSRWEGCAEVAQALADQLNLEQRSIYPGNHAGLLPPDPGLEPEVMDDDRLQRP